MTTTTNTVKLANGTDRVTFVIEQGSKQAYMINSEAEWSFLAVEDARARIATLVAAGWEVRAAG